MTISEKLSNQKGVTLIELLVALALVGLVLAGGVSFFVFGRRTFEAGMCRANLQHNLSTSAEVITREARYAITLEILAENDPIPSTPGDGDNYIFLRNNMVVVLDADGEFIVTDGIIDSLFFSLNGSMLKFTITGSDSEFEHDLHSSVFLVNEPTPTETTGVAVRYRKPPGS